MYFCYIFITSDRSKYSNLGAEVPQKEKNADDHLKQKY
jgi:hypothetical protein